MMSPKWYSLWRGFCVCGLISTARSSAKRSRSSPEGQQQGPYWRPLRPFVANPRGDVLLPVKLVEVANSLLRISHLLDTGDTFSRQLPLFRKYADWLRSRVVRGPAAAPAGTADKRFVGWSSEHVPPCLIHLWMTSQATLFLLHYAAMLQKHVARQLLHAGRFQIRSVDEAWGSRQPLFANPSKLSRRTALIGLLPRIKDHYVDPRSLGTVADRVCGGAEE